MGATVDGKRGGRAARGALPLLPPWQVGAAYAASLLLHLAAIVGAASAMFDPGPDEPSVYQPQFRKGEQASVVQVRFITLPPEPKPKPRRPTRQPPDTQPPMPQPLPPIPAPQQATRADASAPTTPMPIAPAPSERKHGEPTDASLAHADADRPVLTSTSPPQPAPPLPTDDAMAPLADMIDVAPVAPPQPVSPAAEAGVRRGVEQLSLPTPEYPTQSRRLGEEGLVVLEVEVLADGQVGRIRVLQTSDHQRLVDAAIKAVRNARYRAATIDGRPVRATRRESFQFTLVNHTQSAARQQ